MTLFADRNRPNQPTPMDDTFDWSQLESQFDTASFESLLSTTFSGTLWTPADSGQGAEPSLQVQNPSRHCEADDRPFANLEAPTISHTFQTIDTSQPYQPRDETNTAGQHVVNSYTPVQVFLPPMYNGPVGAVSLPDTTDEGLLHYFMTIASKTWSALDSFGERVDRVVRKLTDRISIFHDAASPTRQYIIFFVRPSTTWSFTTCYALRFRHPFE
jgi:hypothetical protein